MLLQIYGQTYLDQCKLIDKKLRFAYTGFGFNSGIVSLAITEGFNNRWNNYQLPNYTNYLCNPLMIDQFKTQVLLYHPFFKSLPIPGDNLNINVNQALFINYYRRVFNKSIQNYYPFNNANLIKWHLKPQIDNNNKSWGIGSLTMDTIRTIEIHAALNAGKWGINPDDLTKPRKDDLGWRIQRICELLGIRVGTDDKFDPDKEKKIVRQVIPAKQKLDPEKVGINNFGDGGMVVKRINNRFNGDKIESDQCVIIHDLLQLIQEYHEQHNLAIGLQESSAIEIKDPKDDKGKNKARFDNQLGLLLEIFNLLSSANEMTRANLISSLITQSQTSEVIAGLGLPSVTKTIPIKIDKEVTQLPYKGIAPHRSISQEVATCTANVGIVLGQLL